MIESTTITPYWQQDGATVYCGDWLDIAPHIESVSQILTDPPYGIEYVSNGGPRAVDPNIRARTKIVGDAAMDPRWFTEMGRSLGDGGAAYIFGCFETYAELRSLSEAAGLKTKTPLVWNKGNCGMGDLRGDYGNQTEICHYGVKGRHILNGGRDRNILNYQRPSDANRLHPMQKPVDMLVYLIEKSSRPGGVVLDPFMGSGSTGVACAIAGRRFIGIEKEQPYCDIAIARIGGELARRRLEDAAKTGGAL